LKKCGPRRRPTSGRQSQITPRPPSSRPTCSKFGGFTATVPPRRAGSRGLPTGKPASSSSSIRERSLELTTLLIELLDEAGFPVGSPRDPARRGGTVCVKPPDSKRVNRQLAERGVICDWRPDVGLRLGPHFYNTEDELRYAVAQIVELSGRAAPASAPRT